MTQCLPHPTTASASKTRRTALTPLIAAGLFAFATAFSAQGAAIQVNTSGSLLGEAVTADASAAVGALTLRPFETAAVTNGRPETAPLAPFDAVSMAALVAPTEPARFADVTQVLERMTWLLTLLASGAAVWLARTQFTRRRLVPIRNT